MATAFCPPPRARTSNGVPVPVNNPGFAGLVFKIQANLDPNHRDRIAFVRVCSGVFRRDMEVLHVRSGKTIRLRRAHRVFGQERETVDEAYPGDIIGVPNHGTLRVGDTLSETEDLRFTGIPNFAPEILRRVRLDDPMKGKHLKKALESLAEEGVTQVFKPELGSNRIVGVVGQLQLDVLQTRIEAEYGINVTLEPAPYETARWVSADDPAVLDRFMGAIRSAMSTDRDGAPVFLARNSWELNHQLQNNPDVRFSKTKERA